MVIDFHTHCFPDKIAEAAVGKLSDASGGLMPHTDGTLDGLRRLLHSQGVDRFVVNNIATNAKQMQKVNDFAIAINGGEKGDVISFGSVFPDAPDVFEELERIAAAGLKGVKLHPDYQGFFVDDEKMKPIYKKIASLGLIATFHAGLDLAYREPFKNTPDRMKKALGWFDGGTVVNAHWGGSAMAPQVIKELCGLPIYFDVSFGYSVITRPDAEAIIEKHGIDKLLFGTDAPWHTPDIERRLINTLGLSEAEKEKLYSGNALRILGEK